MKLELLIGSSGLFLLAAPSYADQGPPTDSILVPSDAMMSAAAKYMQERFNKSTDEEHQLMCDGLVGKLIHGNRSCSDAKADIQCERVRALLTAKAKELHERYRDEEKRYAVWLVDSKACAIERHPSLASCLK